MMTPQNKLRNLGYQSLPFKRLEVVLRKRRKSNAFPYLFIRFVRSKTILEGTHVVVGDSPVHFIHLFDMKFDMSYHVKRFSVLEGNSRVRLEFPNRRRHFSM